VLYFFERDSLRMLAYFTYVLNILTAIITAKKKVQLSLRLIN
jgi:hypothetical protein